ncbi:DUF4232 domain-containing protein [Umezawaea endophytica]|uniref:DUF4232 domain-containing protein n=1 Tax=Umezawaea endophytica TaxID=1654476 RepID=A0A9X3AHB0_9PSEU|nr:DUF4232 domain-containing protein [Umezawaea endophytica]MCS7481217.1 DUF4232 domain-containing protein [Umezawaea endophytica]
MSGIRRRTALVLSGVVPVVLIAVVAVFTTPAASTSTVLAGDPSPLPRDIVTSVSSTPPPSSSTPTSTSSAPSSTGPTTVEPPASTTTAPAAPAVVQPCRARDLTGRIETPAARFNAAGHRVFLVVLVNAGGTPCSVLGFGTYALLDATSSPMRSVQHNTVWSTVDTVVLAPGSPAYARVSYTVVATGDEPETGPCQPPTGALRVVPPGDAGGLDLPLKVSVCDHGRLEVTEFAAADVF